MTEKLCLIFEAEARQDWSAAYAGYRALWVETHAPEVAAHWGFLCWYLIDRWEEGQLAAMPQGIIKPWLFAKADAMAQALLTGTDVPAVYRMLVAWMKEHRPYTIQGPILSQSEAHALREGLGDVPLAGQFPEGSLLRTYFG